MIIKIVRYLSKTEMQTTIKEVRDFAISQELDGHAPIIVFDDGIPFTVTDKTTIYVMEGGKTVDKIELPEWKETE